MKKSIATVLAYAGLVNFMVVAIVILLSFVANETFGSFFNTFAGYIRFSFVPAIASMIFAKKLEYKKSSSFLFNINIVYLVLYVIESLIITYLKMHG